MPAVVEPTPITRDGLGAVSDPAKYEAFLRQVARSKLVDYRDPNMSDPKFFEVALQTAFATLKHSVTNVRLHDQVENSGCELNPKWIEKGAALVAYVQRELRYEFFRALCLDAFEEYQRSRK